MNFHDLQKSNKDSDWSRKYSKISEIASETWIRLSRPKLFTAIYILWYIYIDNTCRYVKFQPEWYNDREYRFSWKKFAEPSGSATWLVNLRPE